MIVVVMVSVRESQSTGWNLYKSSHMLRYRLSVNIEILLFPFILYYLHSCMAWPLRGH